MSENQFLSVLGRRNKSLKWGNREKQTTVKVSDLFLEFWRLCVSFHSFPGFPLLLLRQNQVVYRGVPRIILSNPQ